MNNGLTWHKSSYSGDDGECLEVAPSPDPVRVRTGSPTIHIRDSKSPHGPTLHIRQATWTAFLAAISPLGSRT
ncbi:DUF397 domain-containing protein [Streptomyces silvensis]|uniref:DUF397 domain-containing protein n=1 Tax=Streptomyces silvensis TaxID=1765722 RepID=UPI00099E69BB|nr:DUF397 domain-containing protein [Streptomyces silvensis]